MGTEPWYNEVIVVNDSDGSRLLAMGIAAPDGSRISTVPSCPSAGRARVAVTATEPAYSEVIVVND
jgi:hypothetical protein